LLVGGLCEVQHGRRQPGRREGDRPEGVAEDIASQVALSKDFSLTLWSAFGNSARCEKHRRGRPSPEVSIRGSGVMNTAVKEVTSCPPNTNGGGLGGLGMEQFVVCCLAVRVSLRNLDDGSVGTGKEAPDTTVASTNQQPEFPCGPRPSPPTPHQGSG